MALGYPPRLLSFGLVVKRNVQIPAVRIVGSTGQLSTYRLTRLDRQNIGEVEDRLLPMGVLGVWPSAEAHWLVAGGELDVKPGDQGVNVVGSSDVQLER